MTEKVLGVACTGCGEALLGDDAVGLEFELVEFPDGREGFSALEPRIVTCCHVCGTEDRHLGEDVKPPDLKRALSWLLSRVGERRNPFHAGREGGTATQGPPAPPEAPEAPESPEAPRVPPEFDRDGQPDSSARKPVVRPSIRNDCPRQPITDRTVQKAKRQLKRYSLDRSKPSFNRLMKKFGADPSQEGGDE